MSDEAQWFGHAGHFIGSRDCLFHMTTVVNGYLVSTVGDYHPGDGERKTIGYQRYFETYVFVAEYPGCTEPDCGCGLPGIDGQEIDSEGYQTGAEAQTGHMRMVAKYASAAPASTTKGDNDE